MARKDPSFTGDDLIRFLVYNLEDDEKADVLAVVTLGFAINVARKAPFRLFLSFLGIVARFIPGPFGTVFRFVLRFYKLDRVAVEIDKLLTRAHGVISRTKLSPADIAGVVQDADNVIFEPTGPR